MADVSSPCLTKLPARAAPCPSSTGLRRGAGAALLLLTALASGCALVDDTVLNVTASRTQASAHVHGQLLRGVAYYTQGRVGQVHLKTEEASQLACSGTLTLTGTQQGVAQMNCSNGQTVEVPFTLLTPLRATGRGRMGNADFLFTYGLPPEQAGPFLGLPVHRLMAPES